MQEPTIEGAGGPAEELRVIRAEFVLSWPRWRKGELESLPQTCFVGRSNSGKSSLINCLVNRRNLARTSRTPGRTQALNVFRVELRRGTESRALHVIDPPGYGYANAPKEVRSQWIPMMEGYLTGNPLLRTVFVLLDLRHEPTGQDMEVLELLGDLDIPAVPVATKCDKIPKTRQGGHFKQIGGKLGVKSSAIHRFSAVTREGREELLELLWQVAEPLETGA